MSTAFEEFHPSQHSLYAKYAELGPATSIIPVMDLETVNLAREILATTHEYDTAQELTALLRYEKRKYPVADAQFDLFAIRSASGQLSPSGEVSTPTNVLLDIYLVDKDDRICSVTVGVNHRIARVTGMKMMYDFALSLS